MLKAAIASTLVACWLQSAAAAPPPSVPPESTLRRDVQEARWPAEVARLAGQYVAAYPEGPAAPMMRAWLELASRSVAMLERSDVHLYRADFQLESAPPAAREEARRAALGDKDAALRLAQLYRRGEAGVERDANRYVGWLQFASALGSGPASYELALHYRRENQPALAAPYETRAEELGFKAPRALDHVRK